MQLISLEPPRQKGRLHIQSSSPKQKVCAPLFRQIERSQLKFCQPPKCQLANIIKQFLINSLTIPNITLPCPYRHIKAAPRFSKSKITLLLIIIEFLMEKEISAEQNYFKGSSKGSEPSSNEYEVTNYHYYQKYELIHEQSTRLQACFQDIQTLRDELNLRISSLYAKVDSFTNPIKPKSPEKKKRARRAADQIHKCHTCTVPGCAREYATESSYRNHIKLRHPLVYQAKKRGRRVTNMSAHI